MAKSLPGIARYHNPTITLQESAMQDFLDEHFLREQVESIKHIVDYIANLKRVGPGLGEYMFDQHTLKGRYNPHGDTRDRGSSKPSTTRTATPSAHTAQKRLHAASSTVNVQS
ncbi:hypothetical protein Bbelb_081660 [Branchiostoma belcheri]|nr:hypothetical protein Bbelb_081660 [Branchiostoma belcheri]